ncbi:acylphosphatase-2 isoform X1 [Haliaeetus albicilla]|uniref:acylphosphatase-2 isoform X1 n=1 Tax=Haliaeetus albicilla TaxID=8969 RepID=UPI0037E97C18
MSALAKASGALKSVDYEVFGRVQGVCFRMYTEEEARKLGVVGWVKNTSQGTVTGQVQGPEDKVNAINHGGMGRRRCLGGIILYGSQVLSTNRCTLQTCSCWSLLLANSH